MMKNGYLPKISILLQFGGEILALLCPDDSIQLLINIWNGDKIRRIYMESSGHNGAHISPPICNKLPSFGKKELFITLFQKTSAKPIIS